MRLIALLIVLLPLIALANTQLKWGGPRFVADAKPKKAAPKEAPKAKATKPKAAAPKPKAGEPRIRGANGEVLPPDVEAKLAHNRRQMFLMQWSAQTQDAPLSNASDATWLAKQSSAVQSLAKLIVATQND